MSSLFKENAIAVNITDDTSISMKAKLKIKGDDGVFKRRCGSFTWATINRKFPRTPIIFISIMARPECGKIDGSFVELWFAFVELSIFLELVVFCTVRHIYNNFFSIY